MDESYLIADATSAVSWEEVSYIKKLLSRGRLARYTLIYFEKTFIFALALGLALGTSVRSRSRTRSRDIR